MPPAAFTSVVGMLGASGLAKDARVIIEKPFGTDLDSARELNQAVHAVFDESQVFRIDHFLGKESVDNILAFRFANGLFEPIWNRAAHQYVQIDVPETLSIEGRAAFYDATGAYRDMVVTHLFQVLGVRGHGAAGVAVAPSTLRDEKVKVFDALRPIDVRHVVRGQYEGYTLRARRARPTPTPRRWSRCGPRSRTGAGTACRSTCARARPWRHRGRSSRSASTSRRCGCSTRTARTSRPAG